MIWFSKSSEVHVSMLVLVPSVLVYKVKHLCKYVITYGGVFLFVFMSKYTTVK